MFHTVLFWPMKKLQAQCSRSLDRMETERERHREGLWLSRGESLRACGTMSACLFDCLQVRFLGENVLFKTE